ncbi:RagB/SusD family nutrient uptake outer membrane protein [Dyadobacter flavalbus]|uniref:RagB/SusD family nutrient uptake outer membrane protein n=1 Tax=Dyadobacter flavalbus TaxID=2579942 RepID=A0A5M8QV06_9BACT|nr:RagB/SusD family nutrient uptake outer membrane protein [Dyadobacter flavalbus]KAA6438890.1 RagB/SusD family nutrient uptake outer membrane protein [Dyadobacter flavalbus]
MTRTYIYFTTVLTVLLLSAGSCRKSFLDLAPYTEVPANKTIRTVSDLQTALNGCYAQLASSNLFGRSLPLIGDLASDNVYMSTRNSGKYLAFDQNLITSNNTEYKGIWYDGYSAILRANNVINANLSPDQSVRQIKGEAFALRGLMYFTLVKTFARPYTYDPEMPGVPLVLTYDPTSTPPRNSIREVYGQIMADLDSAAQMIVADNGSARFSKSAVLGISAKVSLYRADYKMALALSQEIIDAEEYKLLSRTDFISYWASSKPHTPGNKQETLFEVSSDELSNAGPDELAYMYQQAGYGDLLAAKSLLKLYSKTDIRAELVIAGKREAAENPAFIVNKYTFLSGDLDDKKVIRLSEIYLIASESAFRLHQEQKALFYLNKLIKERDPGQQYSSYGLALLEDILLERRKELAFEGDRFYDLNRLQSVIQKKDGQFKGDIPFGHPFRIGPIPEAEINENPGMVQNEGY